MENRDKQITIQATGNDVFDAALFLSKALKGFSSEQCAIIYNFVIESQNVQA